MKNKLFTLCIAILASLSLWAQSGTCGPNLTWTIQNETLTISGTGEMDDWNGSSPWYSMNITMNITTVIINPGVTSIGNYAFVNNYRLTSVTIPNSVTSIGAYAFSGCQFITSINFPESVTYVGNNAFSGLYRLNYQLVNSRIIAFVPRSRVGAYVIPDGVTTIVGGAFSLSGITSISIPNSVTYIGPYAFSGCSNLTSISIPSTITQIMAGTFAGCTSFTLFEIPTSITEIGPYAFNSCTGLTSISIPNSVTTIGRNAFFECTGLTAINLPNGLETIDEETFNGCSGLTSITIPTSVTSIGEKAFANCTAITAINIPSNVTSLGKEAFTNCNNLTDVTIAGGLSSIANGAFSYCSQLRNVSIYQGLTDIKGNAFYSCRSINYISIPNSVTYIGESAFGWCRGLRYIYLPNSVTYIGNYAFQGCSSLVTAIIPDSLSFLGNKAFGGCTNLTNVYMGKDISNINGNVFEGCTSLPVFDNIRYADTYLVEVIDKTQNNYVIKPGTQYIGSSAFSNCNNLTSFVIPNSVKLIGDYIFYNCRNLSSIVIGDSVCSIGYNAFNHCPQLASIVVEPGNSIFDSRNNCNAIIRTEKDQLVRGCKNTIIPVGITSIGSNAFSDCDSLISLTLPNTIQTINSSAFAGCSDLKSITIPSSVTKIFDCIVSGCSKLDGVLIDALTPPDCFSNSFPNNIPIYVPAGTLSIYQNTKNWGSFLLHVDKWDLTENKQNIMQVSATIAPKYGRCVIGSCGIEGEKTFSGNTFTQNGLDPDSTYQLIVFINTTAGDYDTLHYSVTMPSLVLQTLPAQATSNTCAIIAAQTNLSNEEVSCGFEWRRYDAPELVPSTTVYCGVNNGMMAGRLQGLSPSTYYMYRPFYRSLSDSCYYGDWIAFGTADAYVHFDPIIYTYEPQHVDTTSAALVGYVMAGSDDISEQGFEYWAESRVNSSSNQNKASVLGEHHTIQAAGNSMNVSLSGLDEGTMYQYRTYAMVNGLPIYGSTMSFTTLGEFIETSIEVVNESEPSGQRTARKVWIDGHLFILLPDGTRYTSTGKRVE